jgi:hypothetical protein
MECEKEKTFILEGTWKGDGQVTDKIPYKEELQINKLKPILYSWSSKTWNDELGVLHLESGYLKKIDNIKLELLLAHPFGVTEISEGIIEGNKITFKTKNLSRTSTAKEPYATSYTRVFVVEGDKLTYDMYLGTNKYEERHHLTATLAK